MTTILIVGASGGVGSALFNMYANEPNTAVIGTYCQNKPHTELGLFLHCDLNNHRTIKKLASDIKKHTDRVDILINCVGILHTHQFRPEKSISQLNPMQLRESFDVNAIGQLLILKEFQPFLKSKQMSIAVTLSARIGSIEDNQLGGWYAYRMSKAALNMGLKTLDIEWRRASPNIKSLIIHPGTTDTSLTQPYQRTLKQGQLQTPQWTAQQIINQIETLKKGQQPHLFIDYKGDLIPW